MLPNFRFLPLYFMGYFSILFLFVENNNHSVIDDKIPQNDISLGKYEKMSFYDDFENGLQKFWEAEVTDSNRYQIVSDPLNPENKVLKINLLLDDYTNGGRRSELKIVKMPELDYLSRYSFRFLVPDDFFRTDEDPGIILIHQWHDQADPGFNWRTQK